MPVKTQQMPNGSTGRGLRPTCNINFTHSGFRESMASDEAGKPPQNKVMVSIFARAL